MIPADLRDGPLELEEVRSGVFVCPRHDDAAPRTSPGVCEWCVEEIADAEQNAVIDRAMASRPLVSSEA